MGLVSFTTGRVRGSGAMVRQPRGPCGRIRSANRDARRRRGTFASLWAMARPAAASARDRGRLDRV